MFGCCPDADVTAWPSTFSIRIALGESYIQNGTGFETYSWLSFPVFLPKVHYNLIEALKRFFKQVSNRLFLLFKR